MQAGTVRSHPLLTVRFLRTDLETTRFGLATGRKLGGAVVRNRVRRRLREVLRAMAPSFQPGWDVLIIARPAIVEADHRTLVETLRRLLQRGRSAGRTGGCARRRRRRDRAHPALPVRLRLDAVQLPLRADLLALHRAGDREVRALPGQLDGRQADRPLPPLASRRLRPGSLTPHEDSVTRPRLRSGIARAPAPARDHRPRPRSSPRAPCRPAHQPERAAAPPLGHADPRRRRRSRSSRRSSRLDPISLIAWLFTPLYQTFFILLVLLDQLFGNIAIAIIVLTRRAAGADDAALPAPDRVVQADAAPRARSSRRSRSATRATGSRPRQAQQQLYKERGISPLSGCLPILLVTLPLIPLYSVFSAGLSNYNPQAMLTVFGRTIVDLNCSADPDVQRARARDPMPGSDRLRASTGASRWSSSTSARSASASSAWSPAALMFLQSRMSLPSAALVDTNDPNQRIQRQMGAIFPLIYVFLGATWPAGLLLYIVVSTIFSIVQQYLFTGWGGMFPFFGWQPGFAVGHTPRFPIAAAAPGRSRRPGRRRSPLGGAAGKAAAVDKTIRHKERGRQGRRGRRR